jgi:oligosaccharide repeat unit polymerase
MIVSRSIFFLIIIWSFYVIISFYDFNFDQNILLIYPSTNTIILIICFILSLLIGSVIFNLNNYSSKYKSYTTYYKLSSFLENKIFYFFIISYFLVLLFIYFRFLLYLNFFDVKLTRPQIYSFTNDDIYPLKIIYTFLIFSESVLQSFLYFFFVKFLIQKKYFDLYLIFISNVLDCLIFQSFGGVTSIFFFSIYFFLLKLLKVNIKFILLLTLFIFLGYLIVLFFNIERYGTIYDFLSLLLFYFKISPVLLSSVVDNNLQVFYNKWSIENIFSIFSGLDYLITIILRGITGFSIQTYGYEIVKFIDTAQVIGSKIHGTSVSFINNNTFYSILLEPYLSFGFFGVVLLGGASGYFISKHEYIYLKYNCDNSLFWLILLSGNIAFGIFGSFFSSVNFWIVLVIFVYSKKFIFIEKFYRSNN